MIQQRRRLAHPLMAGFLVWLLLMVLYAGYKSRGNPDLLMAWGPLVAYLTYGCLVFVFNATRVRVDRDGFQLKMGPLPCAIPTVEARKEAVKELFPRDVLVATKYGGRHEFYASVELEDGTWVNLLGPYWDWAGASAAVMEVLKMWNFASYGAGRTARPKVEGPSYKWTIVVWSVSLVAVLAWGFAR